jgi:hypothetical protein
MRKLVLTAALLIVSTPAMAEDLLKSNPATDSPVTDVIIQSGPATEAIIERYIETNGWCDRPAPQPNPGQIVIYFVRDESGECVPRAIQGK